MIAIDWSKVPKGYNYVCIDSNLTAHAYKDKPTPKRWGGVDFYEPLNRDWDSVKLLGGLGKSWEGREPDCIIVGSMVTTPALFSRPDVINIVIDVNGEIDCSERLKRFGFPPAWHEEMRRHSAVGFWGRFVAPWEDAPGAGGEAVSHPAHYSSLPAVCSSCGEPIECIDVVQHMNFNLGNVVKYVWRAGSKGDVLEDLRKARQYLDFEIERLEGEACTKK
jgi:hypothetical protein